MDEYGSRNRRFGITSRFRLREYDYSTPGMYFITICTEGRACLFGDVVDGQTILSPPGQMVTKLLDEVAVQFNDVIVDNHVTMPNHIHALIGIGLEHHDLPHKGLSDVVGWYKSLTTTLYIRGVKSSAWPRFQGRVWQDGFHDHVVRDERDLTRIREYIAANPALWHKDAFFSPPSW